MTDNEIIKALECCSIPTLMSRKCEGCPMRVEKALCFSRLAHDAICIIKRQQAEIERVTINMNAFGLGMKREKERADNAEAELDKLQPYKLHYGNLRMEIAREFADRLKKEIIIRATLSKEQDKNIIWYIDNFLEEMEAENGSEASE